MRNTIAALALAAVAVLVAGPADAAPDRRDPYAGYVYPAGGQRGTTIVVRTGGQNLTGVTAAHVSGQGIHTKILRHLRPLSRKQQGELRRRLAAAWRNVRDKKSGKTRKPRQGKKGAEREVVELPDHPMLNGIETMKADELRRTSVRFLGTGNKRQPNTQIGETVEIEITIERGAAPGRRELRLETPRGLTNPVRFRVGALPEVYEDEHLDLGPPESGVLELPVLLNGQILPGDTDRFRFRARKGRKLVIRTEARSLIPYLADAVPGWFQAVTALYDAEGREVAFADDWRFDPDPTLLFEVPETGEYVFAIRDSIHRGREDFVYRVSIDEQPFVTGLFPLGGALGMDTAVTVLGWNLGGPRLALDTRAADGGVAREVAGGVRWTQASRAGRRSNRVPYVVGALPECMEAEPKGDAIGLAQPITLPCVVNGRIESAGDVDVYQFLGQEGQEVVAEVLARRLQSPLDSLVRVTDASGNVLAWNDDHQGAGSGLLTHHADSWLRTTLPDDGVYHVRIADAQRHGGPDHAYRLRVSAPLPDFEVFVTPSSLALRSGRAAPIRLHAIRRDGFEGAIDVAIAGGPAGFLLSGATIPAGRDSIRMTLTAPGAASAAPVVVELAARAGEGEARIEHPVVPADDMMQAFLWRHLTPAQDFVVAVRGPKKTPPSAQLATARPTQLPMGGTAEVRVSTPGRQLPDRLQLVLIDPPEGIGLVRTTIEPGGMILHLRAAPGAAALAPGFTDNLIVEAFGSEVVRQKKGKKLPPRMQRASYGYLPAIPIVITEGAASVD